MSINGYGGGGSSTPTGPQPAGPGTPTGQYNIPSQPASAPIIGSGQATPPVTGQGTASQSQGFQTSPQPQTALGPTLQIGSPRDLAVEDLSFSELQAIQSLSEITPDIEILSMHMLHKEADKQYIPDINLRLGVAINNEFLEDWYFSYLRIRAIRVSDDLFGNPVDVDWLNNYEESFKDNPILSAIDLNTETGLGGQFIFANQDQKIVNVENISITSGIRSQTLGDNIYFKINSKRHPNLLHSYVDNPTYLYYIFHVFVDFEQLLADYGIKNTTTTQANVANSILATPLPIKSHQNGKAVIVNALTGDVNTFRRINIIGTGPTTARYEAGEIWQGAVNLEMTDDQLHSFVAPSTAPKTDGRIAGIESLYAAVPSKKFSSYYGFFDPGSFPLIRQDLSLSAKFSFTLEPVPVSIPANTGATAQGSLNMGGNFTPPPKNSTFNMHLPAPVASPAQILFDLNFDQIIKEQFAGIAEIVERIPNLLDNFLIEQARVYRTRISKANSMPLQEELILIRDYSGNAESDDLESSGYSASLRELNLNTFFSNEGLKHFVLNDSGLKGDDGDSYRYRVEFEIGHVLDKTFSELGKRFRELPGALKSYTEQVSTLLGETGLDSLLPQQRKLLYDSSEELPLWVIISSELASAYVAFGIDSNADDVATRFFNMLHPSSLTASSLSRVSSEMTELGNVINTLVEKFGLSSQSRNQSGGLKNRVSHEVKLNETFLNTGAGYSYISRTVASDSMFDSYGLFVENADSFRDSQLTSKIPLYVKLPNSDLEDIRAEETHDLLQTKIIFYKRTGNLLIDAMLSGKGTIAKDSQQLQNGQSQTVGEDGVTIELLENLEEISEDAGAQNVDAMDTDKEPDSPDGDDANLTSLYEALLVDAKYDPEKKKADFQIPEGSYLADMAPSANVEIFYGYDLSQKGDILMRSPIFRTLTLSDIENKPNGSFLCRFEQQQTEYLGLKLPVINKYFLLGPPLAMPSPGLNFEAADFEFLRNKDVDVTLQDRDEINQQEAQTLAG